MTAFLQSVPISAIAVVLGIAIFMFLCLKGIGTVLSGVIAAAFVGITAYSGIVNSLFTSFLSGAATFLQAMLLVFVAGATFGGMLNATGCSDRIGITMAKLLGDKNIFILIYVLCIVLQMAGVQPVLVISFISFGMLRKLDLPRYIAMVATMGASFLVLFGPASTNMVASNALGTSIYTKPVYTIIVAIFYLALLHCYVLYLVRDARKKGKGYDPMPNEGEMKLKDESKLPSFGFAIAPVIFVIAWCLVMINVFGWASGTAGVSGMLIAAFFLLFTRGKYIEGNKFKVMENAAKPVLYALICSCCAVGFATVVQDTAVFDAIIGSITKWGLSGYLIAILGTVLFSAICADGNAGASSFLGSMGETLMNSGLDIGIVHRLVQWSAATFDSLPHNGSVVMFLTLFGYDHKSGYKYIIVSNIVITSITTVFAYVLALIFF